MDDAVRRLHIRSCVLDALSQHGIAHDNPMGFELEANATIAAGDNSRVIMKNGNSLDVEIQDRLDSARTDEGLRMGPRTVAKSDTDGVRINFDDIAAGKVRVTE